MKYLVGIDGGGTRTRALIATVTGEILGRGESGPANFLSTGLEQALCHIADSIEQALHTSYTTLLQPEPSAVHSFPIARMTLGLAGVGRPRDHAQMLAALNNRFAAQVTGITLTTDAHIALTGAVEGQNGIVVIAGTGAIALGVKDGQQERAGGWGYLLDDRGSGYDLGRQAITAALRHYDGRARETVLTERICQHYQVLKITDLIAPIYQGEIDRAGIAGLTPLLAQAADEGDPVAREILQVGGRELACAAIAVAKRLCLTGRFKIAGTGGLLTNRLAVLYPAYTSELCQQLPDAEICDPAFDPVYGALVLAAQEEGIPTEPMIRRWKHGNEAKSDKAE